MADETGGAVGGGDSGAASGGGAAPSAQAGSAAPAAQGAAGGSAPAAAAPAETKYYEREVNVRGQAQKVRFTEDELWNHARKGMTFDTDARALAQQRKEMEQRAAAIQEFEQSIQEGRLRDYLSRRNPKMDITETLTRELAAVLEQQAMSPEQRAAFEAQQRAEAAENELKRRDEEVQQQQHEQQKAQRKAALGAKFASALEKSKLPKNDLTLAIMSGQYHSNKQNGLDLSDDELAQATDRVLGQQIDHFVADLDDNAVLDRFPALTKRIHKALLARYAAKSGTGAAPPRPPAAPAPIERAQPKLMSDAEMHKSLGIKGLRSGL